MSAGSILTLPAIAENTQELRIIQNGEDVGYVKAETDGATTQVEYYVDSNGRGPKHTETIIVDAAGIPVSWTVSGTSLMGAGVEESFRLEGSQASWESQAPASFGYS